METIGNEFKAIWMSPESETLAKSKLNESQKYIHINRVRVLRDNAMDARDFIMNEFANNTVYNIYELHLGLVDYCIQQLDMKEKKNASAIYLSQIFENWIVQQKNKTVSKKAAAKQQGNVRHLSPACDENKCLCTMRDDYKQKALDLTLRVEIGLLTIMNKVYGFGQSHELLESSIVAFLRHGNKSDDLNKFKLLSELNVDRFYEHASIDFERVRFQY